MKVFLTHITTVDSVDILHKFTCMELKTEVCTEDNLNQIIKYENWLVRKLADGDSEMVQTILFAFSFDDKVKEYVHKRKLIEEKSVRLDETIHKFAVTLLLSRYESECILTQGNYAYQAKGGDNGCLRYKKGDGGKWVLIANWCFYGLHIVVRYRKPVWLRPMYKSLFTEMNFLSTTFQDYSIELVCSDGQTLQNRRFRLSPPSAFNRVMSEKFGYPEEQIQFLRTKVSLN